MCRHDNLSCQFWVEVREAKTEKLLFRFRPDPIAVEIQVRGRKSILESLSELASLVKTARERGWIDLVIVPESQDSRGGLFGIPPNDHPMYESTIASGIKCKVTSETL